jgi:hypothetical protein
MLRQQIEEKKHKKEKVRLRRLVWCDGCFQFNTLLILRASITCAL